MMFDSQIPNQRHGNETDIEIDHGVFVCEARDQLALKPGGCLFGLGSAGPPPLTLGWPLVLTTSIHDFRSVPVGETIGFA